MPKPVTPMVGCDVFVLNSDRKVLLIRRTDNGLWALPGGCQNLGETPVECAERECREESGYQVKVTELLGVFSSLRYPYIHYPWKENEFCHPLFPMGTRFVSSSDSRKNVVQPWRHSSNKKIKNHDRGTYFASSLQSIFLLLNGNTG